jgi:hypothetical protein
VSVKRTTTLRPFKMPIAFISNTQMTYPQKQRYLKKLQNMPELSNLKVVSEAVEQPKELSDEKTLDILIRKLEKFAKRLRKDQKS